MKGLECPNCREQVLKLWEFFIFPSPFWLTKRCRNCNIKVGFDYNVVYQVVLFFILAMIVGWLIETVISFEFILIDVAILLFFILVPFFMGKKLFILKEESECGNK